MAKLQDCYQISFHRTDGDTVDLEIKKYAICDQCIGSLLRSLSGKGQDSSSCVVTVLLVPPPLAESRKLFPTELPLLLSGLGEKIPHLRPP